MTQNLDPDFDFFAPVGAALGLGVGVVAAAALVSGPMDCSITALRCTPPDPAADTDAGPDGRGVLLVMVLVPAAGKSPPPRFLLLLLLLLGNAAGLVAASDTASAHAILYRQMQTRQGWQLPWPASPYASLG